jgi:hypothetical protein
MANQREKITKKTEEILENSPHGIRYADLTRKISEELTEAKLHTINGTIWNLKKKIENGEIKNILVPERGFYILKKYYETEENEEVISDTKIKEEDFYQPFADYLVNELEECTKAKTLGGNRFQDRWGTPDVIGTYRIFGIGNLQPPPEVISAEIKLNNKELITSLGQACSYKLFSHKVYLVIPKDSNEADIKRIESLCLKFGIGLILFDRTDTNNPSFQILTRAVKDEPDYYYLNKYFKLIEDVVKDLF